jgi:Putative DNA-binding domain
MIATIANASAAIDDEAAHQNALIKAVFSRADTLAGFQEKDAAAFEAGLAVYRNSASLNAAQAMALIFPAVSALLGEADFYPLAQKHWLAHPPEAGDWSQYGSDFGDWMAAMNPGGVLDALPFLPDLARLDLALTRCQDAADAHADLSTLALLEQDPSKLQAMLHPSVSVLTLGYDVLALRQAVLTQTPPALRLPLPTPVPLDNHLLITREHWRAKACALDAATAHFIKQCLSGANLLQAHDAAVAVDAAFEVSAWLNQAIATQSLLRIATIDNTNKNSNDKDKVKDKDTNNIN